MNGHHFISYSRRQAKDFASTLTNNLLIGSPPIRVWLDARDVRPGRDWDDEIVEAIRACESLLFVMTHDSVRTQSVCKREWTRALKYKKPIVPLLLDRDAEMPFRLDGRQYIDFSKNFDVGLARLTEHLQWLASPEGELQTLEDRLIEAERDLQRTSPEQRGRIQDEIETLQQQIAHQQRVVENPEQEETRRANSIKTGIEREREPENPVSGISRTKFINPPPVAAPSYWQNRYFETKLIGEFLKDDALRLMSVVGRGGIGKTAMVCRLLKSLEGGQLPDEGGPLSVDGIVYLSERGSRGVNVPYIYADLCELLPDDVAKDLDKLYKNPQASIEAKMYALLEAFTSGRYVLLLDNFEDMVDPETGEISDGELKGALHALLEHPYHKIKVIVTTRFAPRPQELALVRPELQKTLNIDEGLKSPYAEDLLCELDADGTVGLKTAPEHLLAEARRRTRGNPRALEHLFAILSTDRDTSLPEILQDTKGLLPEEVVEVLVGEAFSRLDPVAQMVMQALAIYSYPVTPAALDYLLLPHHAGGVDSAPVLSRLVNMRFVHKESGKHYYLHQVTRAYALSRVPEGEATDRYEIEAPSFTQIALLNRAADYLRQTRTPRESWKTIEDLTPQLQEFELRYAGQDYETAANVLLEIDFDYLFLWGHFRLMTELHERLQSKLNDRYLEMASLSNLGSAYSEMGRNREAIAFHKCSLKIAREMEDREGEGHCLGNLGKSYRHLGQTKRAIEYYEQALQIARELEDRYGESTWLVNLGNRYRDLGQTNHAIEYYEGALEIAREIGYRALESFSLTNMGGIYSDRGEWDRAKQLYQAAIQIADEIGFARAQSEARGGLALAFLYAGDLSAARAATEEARQYEYAPNRANVWALLGVIALSQGDRAAAQKAFGMAVDEAESLLDHNEHNYDALDNKALALCGLDLCEESSEHIPAALEAYRAARAINNDVGNVRRALRLLDALAQADSEGMLAEVRPVVRGSMVDST